ncbi:CDGSH iron-sulfur domain-containing protein 3, mitochondrial [Armigeres subalbatus]|uniref:CDGSH iron-sulfur domain-containing protein 3, mitochondrial n=1 Tax=Armigeres subalbatus TaxID=124917 RepID=UPI002ED248FF
MNILRSAIFVRSSVPSVRFFTTSSVRLSSGEIPKNVIDNLSTAQHQQGNGVIYDKKPFRIELVEGKRYSWCLCGRSKSQPLCDGTHKLEQYKITLRPVRFQVEKTGTYWLCNCKHTKNRPFCDGTHKIEDIQKTAGKN